MQPNHFSIAGSAECDFLALAVLREGWIVTVAMVSHPVDNTVAGRCFRRSPLTAMLCSAQRAAATDLESVALPVVENANVPYPFLVQGSGRRQLSPRSIAVRGIGLGEQIAIHGQGKPSVPFGCEIAPMSGL